MNRYPKLNLSVEVKPGSSIENTAWDLTNLANNLGIDVVTQFNGIRLMARAGGDPNSIIDAYRNRK